MSYCAVNDIKTPEGFLTEEVLAELTTEKGETVQVRNDRVEALIVDRSEFIDNHLRDRYLVPVPTNETIKNICVKLVTYDLKKKRLGTRLKAPFSTFEKEAINELNQIKKGSVQLNVGDSNDRPPFITVKKKKREFPNDLLDKMP
jgi:phage gp36-like protein